MNVDLLYRILKFVAPLAPAVMALVSLLLKTKDDSGRLTRAGKWSVALVILAAVLAVVTQVAETIRQYRSTEQQLKRNSNLLEQVLRGQYRLENIRASYQLQIPTSLPDVQKYEQRLNGSLPQIAKEALLEKYRQANDIRSAIIEPHTDILFCQNSPLMPSVREEPDAARLVSSLNVRVLLYRKPVKPDRWPLFVVTGAGALQADVEMWFSGGDRCIEYRAWDQRLILRDIGASTNSAQWESSGEILSVLDLRGAQMIVDIHPRRTDQLAGQLPLTDFELFIGSLQALWLPRDRFTTHQLPNDDITYEFVFPESLEEILALQRRYGKKSDR